MTIMRSALLVLLATIAVACNRADSAETKAAADTADSDAGRQPEYAGHRCRRPPPALRPTASPSMPMGAAMLEFHKHLEAYMKMHNEAEGKVPNLKRTDDPVEISSREKALARDDHDAARRRARERDLRERVAAALRRRSSRKTSPSAASPIARRSCTSCRRA